MIPRTVLNTQILLLQRLTHATESHTLDDHELVNTILAALAAEATLLDTTESIRILVMNIKS